MVCPGPRSWSLRNAIFSARMASWYAVAIDQESPSRRGGDDEYIRQVIMLGGAGYLIKVQCDLYAPHAVASREEVKASASKSAGMTGGSPK